MSLLAIVGALLVASGVIGLQMAPKMVEVQKERGKMPLDNNAVTDADRERVMRGSSVLITLIGFGLILFSVL
ncbi:hypothetical protein OB919_00120 [Halobacteria archaeon AArc-curdl1]|uniref:Uncharacterized protein n=1 Tax=Natronosalvus hydrolyticus TaxID=2979988 RepID=A0AAP2Z4S1_9EURY|nr:hypothetical protein [Halobacteria archaeon AArc-curdl1]